MSEGPPVLCSCSQGCQYHHYKESLLSHRTTLINLFVMRENPYTTLVTMLVFTELSIVPDDGVKCNGLDSGHPLKAL